MSIDSLEQAMDAGSIAVRQQRLIALGVALALRGDECVALHLRDALEAGVARDELDDAVAVAAAIAGAPQASGACGASCRARLCAALERLDASGRAQPAGTSPHTLAGRPWRRS